MSSVDTHGEAALQGHLVVFWPLAAPSAEATLTYTHKHVDMHNIHIHINTHKHIIHTNTCTCTHIHTYTCTHMYTYTYAHVHTHTHATFSSALVPALGAASLSLPSSSHHPQGSHLKASWRQRPWQAPGVILGGTGLWQGQTQPLWCGFRSGLCLHCLYKIKPRNSEPQVLTCKARAERPSGWPRGQGVCGVKPPRPHGDGGSEPAV